MLFLLKYYLYCNIHFIASILIDAYCLQWIYFSSTNTASKINKIKSILADMAIASCQWEVDANGPNNAKLLIVEFLKTFPIKYETQFSTV